MDRIPKTTRESSCRRAQRAGAPWIVWAFLSLSLTGCGVIRTSVWLPDSSAIVYTTDEGGVALFDLASGENQLVLPTSPTRAAMPAVSSKGQQFALMQVSSYAQADVLRVHVYDLLGRETGKSESVAWQADNGDFAGERKTRTGAIWSADDDHLLFWYATGRNDRLRFGTFRFSTGEFTAVTETLPLVDTWYFGFSPIRPDGQGYLAVRSLQNGLTNLYFTDWNGWQKRVKASPQLEDFERLSSLRLYSPDLSDRLPIASAGWSGNTLDAVLGEGRLRIDTAASTASHTFDKGLAKLRPVALDTKIIGWTPIGAEGKFAIQGRLATDGPPPSIVLEVYDLDAGRTRPLGRAVLLGERFAPVMHSPNRRYAAVTFASDFGRVLTSVIDDQGRTVATFPVSGPGWRDTLVPVRPRDSGNAAGITRIPREPR